MALPVAATKKDQPVNSAGVSSLLSQTSRDGVTIRLPPSSRLTSTSDRSGRLTCPPWQVKSLRPTKFPPIRRSVCSGKQMLAHSGPASHDPDIEASREVDSQIRVAPDPSLSQCRAGKAVRLGEQIIRHPKSSSALIVL